VIGIELRFLHPFKKNVEHGINPPKEPMTAKMLGF
jgi:hypothetical protein